MLLDNADGDADVLLEEQLKHVDPKVVEFWEYLQSKYNKDSEDEEQLKNYKCSLCFAAFVLLCTKTKNHKATPPFVMHLGLFLHRKGTLKPVWNLLSSLRLSISYQVTKNLLQNKLLAVCPKSQLTDIIIMVADNNDFWSKPGNRGARAEKKATMVHTVQRLTIGTEKYQGRRMLSVAAPNSAIFLSIHLITQSPMSIRNSSWVANLSDLCFFLMSGHLMCITKACRRVSWKAKLFMRVTCILKWSSPGKRSSHLNFSGSFFLQEAANSMRFSSPYNNPMTLSLSLAMFQKLSSERAKSVNLFASASTSGSKTVKGVAGIFSLLER